MERGSSVPMIAVVTPAASVILQYRSAAGLSQEEVSVALGVSPGAVSQWETGRSHPRRAKALRLDELLGAGGAITDALGYALPAGVDDQLERLTETVKRQGEILAELVEQVRELRAKSA